LDWFAGADWPGHYTTNCRVRVVACDNGMVMIPAGSYIRGDNLDSESDAPVYQVFVNPFLMDSNLVSYSQWQTVYNWATNNGYSFDNPGYGKAANHPVVNINWYDAVKWCNARSEMEGVTPVYYVGTDLTIVLRTQDGSGGNVANKLGATNGYRLPTEAEWEKAARGGLSGQRFPWGNTISISETQADYLGLPANYSYDLGPYGTNSTALVIGGGAPWTTPVGSFPANGYGLFDMAGNVNEWCWEIYSSTSYQAGQTNPPSYQGSGSTGGALCVIRGGSWTDNASVARCAARGHLTFLTATNTVGFRCVRGF